MNQNLGVSRVMLREINSDVRYNPTRVVVFKWFLPIVALLGTMPLLEPTTSLVAVLLALLLVGGAIFAFSAAQVRVSNADIAFRRFRRWHHVAYRDIQKCRISWFPAMCYMKVRTFVPPWGKVYFISEGPLEELTLPGRHSSLTRYIEERASNAKSRDEHASQTVPPLQAPESGLARRIGMCVLWFCSGAVWLFSRAFSTSAFQMRGPGTLIGEWQHLNNLIVHWPWNLLAGLLLLGLMFLLRFRRLAWGPAFVLGALTGSLARVLFT